MKTAVRLDDVTSRMDYERFNRIRQILDRAGIRPLIGVVPFLKDENLMKEEENADFPKLLKELEQQGWQIALHGYNHLYTEKKAGIFPLNGFSEFAGVPYERQNRMVAEGKEKLENLGVKPVAFMAPGHSFDKNTLRALEENGITRLTDGFGKSPYIRGKITFYPISKKRSECVSKKPGYSTYVIHADTMSDSEMDAFEKLISNNRDCFISFDEYLDAEPETRGFIGNVWEYCLAIGKHLLVSRRASAGTVIHSVNEE